MAIDEVLTPFGPPVEEIPLPHAPLVAVISQVRFPAIASITREEFVGPFQELVRSEYPVLRQDRESSVVITPDGVMTSGDSPPVWRFTDRSKHPNWSLSLAPSFIALSCTTYTSRADFVGRLVGAFEALAETVAPASWDRVGVRYVDRVALDGSVDLSSFVRPEVLGPAGSALGADADLTHSVSDTEYSLPEAVLRARWGQVPAHAQLDPLHGDALDTPSWILDLDMYSAESGEFVPGDLANSVTTFAERIYRYFRWTVTEDFLRHYGGEL